MRASNKNTDQKFKLLLHHFRLGGKFSIADISSLLNCNRQSAYNYLDRIRKALLGTGEILLEEKEGRVAFYSIHPSMFPQNNTDDYPPMSLDIIRKYTIADALQAKPLTTSHLIKNLGLVSRTSNDNPAAIPADFGKTSAYRLINELLEERILSKDTSQGLLRLTGNTLPQYLSLTETTALQIAYLFENTPPGSPYYEALHSIYQKIELQFNEPNAQSPYFSHYQVYGRQHQTMNNLPNQMQRLLLLNYQKKILSITYKGNKNKPLHLIFAIGLIIYSEEKDEFFLIGKTMKDDSSDKKVHDMILHLSSILNISETKKKHNYYHSPYYINLFDEMFGVSIAPLKKVVVQFTCFPNLERKVKILASHRKKSTLEVIQDKNGSKTILYTDYLRGLEDFAAYLRQFGRSAVVLEPESLRKKILFSMKRSLINYREV